MTLSRRTVTVFAAASLSVAVALTAMACSERDGCEERRAQQPAHEPLEPLGQGDH